MPSLKINSLNFQRNNQGILTGINLEIIPGKVTGLVGSSGSGKSTILKILLGYPFPEQTSLTGQILVNGRSEYDQRIIQPVFQDPVAYFNPAWTLSEILEEPLDLLFRISEEEKQKRIYEYLDRMRIDKKSLAKNIKNFSGGQLQRIAIIRALLCKPGFLLMDEPVSALDRIVQEEVLDITASLVRDENVGVLFISHDLDAVAKISDYIYVLHKGRIIEEGTVGQILNDPVTQETKSLVKARDLSGIKDLSV